MSSVQRPTTRLRAVRGTTPGWGVLRRGRRGQMRADQRTREAGRIVTMVPMASLAALICVGIGVDFSGQTMAEQDLRDQAAQCARQAGEGVAMGAITTSQVVTAAYQCLSAAGLTGNVNFMGTSVSIDVAGTYDTKVLTIISINQLPIHGTATASILQGR
ncbi:MAG: hypothetical protein FWF25_04965 [Propionibacteriaceae bacterium]|nr:hypothetical protein [Propionibacteriaceae bacterium]